MNKICKKCGETKDINAYYRHPGMSDGHLSVCKTCKREYAKSADGKATDFTEKGVIRVIYKTQRSNSKRRGHVPPLYTKKELSEWMYSRGFLKLFNKWKESGQDKMLKPSIDRLNDELPYSLGNIQLVTWGYNKKKQTKDMLSGKSTSGERCKPVLQYEKDGKLIAEYVSVSSAGRATGVTFQGISKVCLGKQKTAGGFMWKYKSQ